MLHYPDLRSVRTGWVDLDKVGPKVWLKLRYERWVRHYDHVFVKSHAGVDFQAARLCEARSDDAQKQLLRHSAFEQLPDLEELRDLGEYMPAARIR